MVVEWRALTGDNGRLTRRPGGRKEPYYVRFAEGAENSVIVNRAKEFGMTVPALLHISGLYFVPPPDAPARFQPTRRSRVRDRALAVELARLVPVLQGVARNFNQLVAVANTQGSVLPDQLVGFAQHAQRQLERLDGVLEMLDPVRKGR